MDDKAINSAAGRIIAFAIGVMPSFIQASVTEVNKRKWAAAISDILRDEVAKSKEREG